MEKRLLRCLTAEEKEMRKEATLNEINNIAKKNNLSELSKDASRKEVSELLYNLYIKNDTKLYSNLFYENRFNKSDENQIIDLIYKYLNYQKNGNEYYNFDELLGFFCFSIIDYILENKTFVIQKDFPIFNIGIDPEYKGNMKFRYPRKFFENNGISCISLDDSGKLGDGRVYFYKDKDKMEKYLKLEKNNSDIYNYYSRLVLSSYVNEIIGNLNEIKTIPDLQKSPRIDYSIWNVANENNKYDIIKKSIDNLSNNSQNYKVFLLKERFFHYIDAIIFSSKYFCIIKIRVDDGIINVKEPEYYYLTSNDYIMLKNEAFADKMDFGTKAILPKAKSSVFGNAVIGGIIGGSTGSLIGAIGTIDNNNKIEEQRKNFVPSTVEYTSKTNDSILDIYCNNMKKHLNLRLNNFNMAKYHNEFINYFVKTFNNCPDILNISNIIKKDDLLLLTSNSKKIEQCKNEIINCDNKLLNIKGLIIGKKAKEKENILRLKSKALKEINNYELESNNVINNINLKLENEN